MTASPMQSFFSRCKFAEFATYRILRFAPFLHRRGGVSPPSLQIYEFATYRIRAMRIYRTHSVYRAVFTRHIASYRTGDSWIAPTDLHRFPTVGVGASTTRRSLVSTNRKPSALSSPRVAKDLQTVFYIFCYLLSFIYSLLSKGDSWIAPTICTVSQS